MNLVDIIALAKQGYKPNDIKELLAMAETEPAPDPAPAPAQDPAPAPAPDPAPAPAPIPDPETPTPAKETGQAGNDIVEELKATIKDLQQQNIKQDLSGNVPDPQKAIDDMVRAYM